MADERVTVVVGGVETFETFAGTLMQSPYLADWLSDPRCLNKDGSRFLDEDPDVFRCMLSFLRGSLSQIPTTYRHILASRYLLVLPPPEPVIDDVRTIADAAAALATWPNPRTYTRPLLQRINQLFTAYAVQPPPDFRHILESWLQNLSVDSFLTHCHLLPYVALAIRIAPPPAVFARHYVNTHGRGAGGKLACD